MEPNNTAPKLDSDLTPPEVRARLCRFLRRASERQLTDVLAALLVRFPERELLEQDG